jgi:hypothetical protein
MTDFWTMVAAIVVAGWILEITYFLVVNLVPIIINKLDN